MRHTIFSLFVLAAMTMTASAKEQVECRNLLTGKWAAAMGGWTMLLNEDGTRGLISPDYPDRVVESGSWGAERGSIAGKSDCTLVFVYERNAEIHPITVTGADKIDVKGGVYTRVK